MKSAVKVSIFFVLLGAVLANAQYTLPKFEHVIIIVQENRTPDNLFGAATLNPPNLPTLGSGVDLTIAPANTQNGNQPGQPWCLGACFDPKHGNGAWQSQYNAGTYNSCPNGQVTTSLCPASTCNGQTVCPGTGCTFTVPNCPQETYVSPIYDDEPSGVFEGSSPLLPYFDIAHKYGFANYFFQTNQGPSQPAHDFLFGGTSAPTGVVPPPGQNNYYNYFAAGNAVGGSYGQQGCLGPGSEYVLLIDPTGAVNKNYKPSPCFEHQTLVDLLESTNPNFTWKYYTDNPGDIWTAPNGIGHICGVPQLQNGQYVCTGSDFGNVVNPPWAFFADVIEGGTNLPDGDGHGSCQLPNVTWIIPNGYWSDHPGIRHGLSTMNELGPDWVAAIINAVGGATCYDEINQEPWQDTVIFVVWDDWGGFYDHLGDIGLPAQAQGKPGYAPCLFSSDWGCGYTYGFRVPFLVISAYTSDGYVSGACGVQGLPSCPNDVAPYEHDFGSILAFIEYNSKLGIGNINSLGDNGGGYLFADEYAPEWVAPPAGTYLPLGDFFDLWWNSENSLCPQKAPNGCPKGFEYIQVAGPDNYPLNYFRHYTGQVEDPDNDAIDPQD